MTCPSIVKFEDLKESPSVRIELPAPLPIGTRINLCITLRRKHGGRTEELRVNGEFRVTSVTIDAVGASRQIVTIASTGVAPTWKAVKNSVGKKKLALTRSPRTEVA